MTRIARRMADIQPFHVMEILKRAHALAAEGRDIIHLEVGEPDFPSPAPIVEAGRRFLTSGHVHYTPALGLTALREAIARFYHDRFGADVAPERIIVTPGASGALMLALGVLTDPGDEWLLPDPAIRPTAIWCVALKASRWPCRWTQPPASSPRRPTSPRPGRPTPAG